MLDEVVAGVATGAGEIVEAEGVTAAAEAVGATKLLVVVVVVAAGAGVGVGVGAVVEVAVAVEVEAGLEGEVESALTTP